VHTRQGNTSIPHPAGSPYFMKLICQQNQDAELLNPIALKLLVSVQIALHKCLKHLAMIRYSEVRKLMDYDLRSELLGLFEQRGVKSKSALT
jgi:hypothetical protein